MMILRRQSATGVWIALVAVGVVCVLVLSACGGGSSSSEGTGSAAAEGGEPSAAFAGKGENGELATAGTESSVQEREVASLVVEESLEARAAEDFAGQCETLAPELLEALEKRGSKGILKKSCAESLEAMAKRAVPGSFKNTMVEPLAAMRVNGNLAFAFYHGAEGKNYVMLMEKDGTEWKVASLAEQETPSNSSN